MLSVSSGAGTLGNEQLIVILFDGVQTAGGTNEKAATVATAINASGVTVVGFDFGMHDPNALVQYVGPPCHTIVSLFPSPSADSPIAVV